MWFQGQFLNIGNTRAHLKWWEETREVGTFRKRERASCERIQTVCTVGMQTHLDTSGESVAWHGPTKFYYPVSQEVCWEKTHSKVGGSQEPWTSPWSKATVIREMCNSQCSTVFEGLVLDSRGPPATLSDKREDYKLKWSLTREV